MHPFKWKADWEILIVDLRKPQPLKACGGLLPTQDNTNVK